MRRRERLEKLIHALEQGKFIVRKRTCTRSLYLRIHPLGEQWFAIASLVDGNRLYRIPIHRVAARARFPDLKIESAALRELQIGWRASDEYSYKGKPAMTTAREDQVLSWTATRYGALRISVIALNLNAREPTFVWHLRAKDWEQHLKKREARTIAEQLESHPLAFLTFYLGDGARTPNTLVVVVGHGTSKTWPRTLVPKILEAAYKSGYGLFLDSIDCTKWMILKSLQLQREPAVRVKGFPFSLTYSARGRYLYASAYIKSGAEARALAEELNARFGVRARVDAVRKCKCWIVRLTTNEVLKLALQCEEWREALRELVKKKNIHARARAWKVAEVLKCAGVLTSNPLRSEVVELCARRFRLFYSRKLFAHALFKSREEAERAAQEIVALGIRAWVCKKHAKYWAVVLGARAVRELAAHYEEWRRALETLEKRHGAACNQGNL